MTKENDKESRALQVSVRLHLGMQRNINVGHSSSDVKYFALMVIFRCEYMIFVARFRIFQIDKFMHHDKIPSGSKARNMPFYCQF